MRKRNQVAVIALAVMALGAVLQSGFSTAEAPVAPASLSIDAIHRAVDVRALPVLEFKEPF
jgi:hypothetical protein